MKKIVSCFCILAMLCITVPVHAVTTTEYTSNTPKPLLQAPCWQEIAPLEASIRYKEPIKRPKWAYPLAWTGYIGTIFIIPFPRYMQDKDNAIANNNSEFYKLEKYRVLYENDIQRCQNIYFEEAELLKCYNEARNNLYMVLGNHSRANLVEEQKDTNRLLRQEIQMQNRPTYSHTTTTRSGNYYYTNTYSY